MTKITNTPSSLLGKEWLKAEGCPDCQMTGYSGRMGIYQLVEVDNRLQDLIVKGATLNEMRRYASERGMRSLMEDGLIKASNGYTTVDEVYRVITTEEGL